MMEFGERFRDHLALMSRSSVDFAEGMSVNAIKVMADHCRETEVHECLLWAAFSENSNEPEANRVLAIASLKDAADIDYVKSHLMGEGLASKNEAMARASIRVLIHAYNAEVEKKFYTLVSTGHDYGPIVMEELARAVEEKKKRVETVELLAEAMKAAGVV